MTDGPIRVKALRSFTDRILRLKVEQDTLTEAIREVYREAKAEGFDKTVLGQLVQMLRRIGRDGLARVEAEDILLHAYLAAYRGDAGAEDRLSVASSGPVAPRSGDMPRDDMSHVSKAGPAVDRRHGAGTGVARAGGCAAPAMAPVAGKARKGVTPADGRDDGFSVPGGWMGFEALTPADGRGESLTIPAGWNGFGGLTPADGREAAEALS